MSGYESTCIVCGQRLTPAQCRVLRSIMETAGWDAENIAEVGDRCLTHLEEFLDQCERKPRVERAAYRRG